MTKSSENRNRKNKSVEVKNDNKNNKSINDNKNDKSINNKKYISRDNYVMNVIIDNDFWRW